MKKIVIAIDGPAAAGKSTTAKLVAEKLNYLHIDTGAMYRALTYKILRDGIDPENEAAVVEALKDSKVDLKKEKNEIKVFLDDEDVSKYLRSAEVTNAVSAVSSYKQVREMMVELQRRISNEGGVVLEGRDIGTVVIPDADLKIFMIAGIETRAKRRQKELAEKGLMIDYNKIVNEIIERDNKDSKRKESPLRKADDAIVLDTSNLSIEEQVNFIVNKALEIIEN
ncbi:MAG: Cytidylate kinase [Ignavibacteriae bacterium]|nr:MAG: Cytidylate kinase [Ignavibacteriota bacterium]